MLSVEDERRPGCDRSRDRLGLRDAGSLDCPLPLSVEEERLLSSLLGCGLSLERLLLCCTSSLELPRPRLSAKSLARLRSTDWERARERGTGSDDRLSLLLPFPAASNSLSMFFTMSAISGGTNDSLSLSSFLLKFSRNAGFDVSQPGRLSIDSFLSNIPDSLSSFGLLSFSDIFRPKKLEGSSSSAFSSVEGLLLNKPDGLRTRGDFVSEEDFLSSFGASIDGIRANKPDGFLGGCCSLGPLLGGLSANVPDGFRGGGLSFGPSVDGLLANTHIMHK